jgi:Flp pilus assembly protein TadG
MLKLSRTRKSLRRCQSGVTAVEFALILPPFIMLLFGIFEFSRMMFVSSSVQHAVDRAARLAAIDPDVSATDIEAAIREFLSVSNDPDITVTVTDATVGTRDVRQVAAHYDHVVSGPLIPEFTVGWDFETVVPLPN